MDPDIKWVATSPGFLELPTTKFHIEYVAGSPVPFLVFWDGKPICAHSHTTLAGAQKAAHEAIGEFIIMGFEV